MFENSSNEDSVSALTQWLLEHNQEPEFRLMSYTRMRKENYKFQATGFGELAFGYGPSEEEAKQDAARQLLSKLRGNQKPPHSVLESQHLLMS